MIKQFKCSKELKHKELEVIKLFEEGKIKEGFKLAFKYGLAKVKIERKQQCDYCGRVIDIKKFDKHLCRDLKKVKVLMHDIPGLTKGEAHQIIYAGGDAEETQISSNLVYDKMFEIMKKRKLEFLGRRKDK